METPNTKKQNIHETTRDHFASVYDAFGDDIFRFCVMKVSDREQARDITQEVFTRFWQTLRADTVVQNERAFLYTLARNLVIDWYRKKKETSLDQLTEYGKEFASLDHVSITENAEVQEVIKVINTLDADSREVLLLRFVDGFSPKDIASIRKESANAVSVRINRSIKKVQELMGANGTTENSGSTDKE